MDWEGTSGSKCSLHPCLPPLISEQSHLIVQAFSLRLDMICDGRNVQQFVWDYGLAGLGPPSSVAIHKAEAKRLMWVLSCHLYKQDVP